MQQHLLDIIKFDRAFQLKGLLASVRRSRYERCHYTTLILKVFVRSVQTFHKDDEVNDAKRGFSFYACKLQMG